MIGTFGTPMQSEFNAEFDEYTTYSIGDPGTTDAIEFDDKKLMLTQSGDYRELTWETIEQRLGHQVIADVLEDADLLGMGYWALIPNFPGILQTLADKVWPTLSQPPEHVFVDPANIRHLPQSQLADGFAALHDLNHHVPVTVSANRAETKALVDGGGASVDDDSMLTLAETARDVIGVETIVSHGAHASAMVTKHDQALIDTLHIDDPEIVTSSGDHFNAGVCLGLLEGFDAGATTALGNAVAGTFIRTGESPPLTEIKSFAAEYADRFRADTPE
jgi:hypothetical protein